MLVVVCLLVKNHVIVLEPIRCSNSSSIPRAGCVPARPRPKTQASRNHMSTGLYLMTYGCVLGRGPVGTQPALGILQLKGMVVNGDVGDGMVTESK